MNFSHIGTPQLLNALLEARNDNTEFAYVVKYKPYPFSTRKTYFSVTLGWHEYTFRISGIDKEEPLRKEENKKMSLSRVDDKRLRAAIYNFPPGKIHCFAIYVGSPLKCSYSYEVVTATTQEIEDELKYRERQARIDQIKEIPTELLDALIDAAVRYHLDRVEFHDVIDNTPSRHILLYREDLVQEKLRRGI